MKPAVIWGREDSNDQWKYTIAPVEPSKAFEFNLMRSN